MGRRGILLILVAAALLALLAFYLLRQPAEQPAQAPAGEPSQPKLIAARVEAGEGGRVLANGTEAAEWSSHEPFTLVLEALPGRCTALSHWEVNGSFKTAEPVTTIRVAGNTTVRAVFRRLAVRLSLSSNASTGLLLVNGSPVGLPGVLEVPCGSLLRLAAAPWANGTHSFTPVGVLVDGSPAGSELRASSNATVTALYRVETHTLVIETNAPGARVLVDGAEVELPARVQRPKPFTALIEAPPLLQVNESFAWGAPEVQVLRVRWYTFTWVAVGAGSARVSVNGTERIRVYYYPLHRVGEGVYATWGEYHKSQRVEGGALVAERDLFRFFIILPENWSTARLRVEVRGAQIGNTYAVYYPYSLQSTQWGFDRGVRKVADVTADEYLDRLVIEFTATRDPPSVRARVVYSSGEVEVEERERAFTWEDYWGEGLKRYVGRLLVFSGTVFAGTLTAHVEVGG